MNRSRQLIVVLLLAAVSAAGTATATYARTAVLARASGPFDGRWAATVTRAQLRRAGADAPLAAKLYGPYTALYEQSRFEIRNRRTGAVARGTFTVRGKVSRVVFASGVGVKPGQFSECTWSVYRDRLTFKAIPGRPNLLCDAPVWVRAG